MHNSNTLAQNLIYLAYSIEREMPSTFQEYNDQYFNEIERYQAEEEARRGQDEQEAEAMRLESEARMEASRSNTSAMHGVMNLFTTLLENQAKQLEEISRLRKRARDSTLSDDD